MFVGHFFSWFRTKFDEVESAFRRHFFVRFQKIKASRKKKNQGPWVKNSTERRQFQVLTKNEEISRQNLCLIFGSTHCQSFSLKKFPF